MKKINIASKVVKEEKLEQILVRLEELKREFAEVVDEYEAEGAESRDIDTLFEALAAVDDAIDGINDVLEE